jgi:hypothetical protein
MMNPMPKLTYTVTPDLLERYIRNAELVAKSPSERLAVQLATELISQRKYKGGPPRRKFIPEMYFSAEEPKAQVEVLSWRKLILKEIHAALCRRSARYKKEVAVIKNSVDLVIVAIAAHVAQLLKVNIAVVAGLVAALLRFISKMGVSVFCQKFKAGLV